MALAERLQEADAALEAIGFPRERIDEIRSRIRKTPVRPEELDEALAGLDIDLPAPAPPRPSAMPGRVSSVPLPAGVSGAPPSRVSLNAEALFADAIADAPAFSPFDDLQLSAPPPAPTPFASDASDLAALLEGDDDVLVVGGGAMALSFDEPDASVTPSDGPADASDALEVESTDGEILEADDFELLIDDSPIEGGTIEGEAVEGEPAEGEYVEGDGTDDGTGQKKGFFRKLFR